MRAGKYWSVFVGGILFLGLVAWFVLACLWWLRGGPLSGLAESHIQGNVPAPKDFQPFLIRDVSTYLKPRYGENVTFGYVFLRDGPTQTGIGFPHFYLWLTITNSEKMFGAAVDVAAINKQRFDVAEFVSQADIAAHPEALHKVFPERLIPDIVGRAKR